MLASLAIFVFSRFALKNFAHSIEKLTVVALLILLLRNSGQSHKLSNYDFEHTLLGIVVFVLIGLLVPILFSLFENLNHSALLLHLCNMKKRIFLKHWITHNFLRVL